MQETRDTMRYGRPSSMKGWGVGAGGVTVPEDRLMQVTLTGQGDGRLDGFGVVWCSQC